MFGMGGTEIIVILIVALLFLGPDKLPEAAKQISKGIRDIKKQSRVLQQTIEDDENIGGAIRDLKSALRGEDEPIRPRIPPKQIEAAVATATVAALPEPSESEPVVPETGALAETIASPEAAAADATAKPAISLPSTAGEPDADVPANTVEDDADLASLVKPAANTIARAPRAAAPAPAATDAPATDETKHG